MSLSWQGLLPTSTPAPSLFLQGPPSLHIPSLAGPPAFPPRPFLVHIVTSLAHVTVPGPPLCPEKTPIEHRPHPWAKGWTHRTDITIPALEKAKGRSNSWHTQ